MSEISNNFKVKKGLDVVGTSTLHGDLSVVGNIVAPVITGVASVPTAALGTTTSQPASTQFVANAILSLIDSAPATLDTLNELATALGDDPNFATTVTNLIAKKTASDLLNWAYTESFQVVSATRDINEVIVTASIIWPNGATGIFTTDITSTAFPGAVDAWHCTHVLAGITKTVTQPAVSRDALGGITAQPAITVN